MLIAKAVEVQGLVQGVWFRASCQDEARRLAVRGWVANRPDGSVAGHFEGEPEAVDGLIAWCQVGPPGAKVDQVLVNPTDPEHHPIFKIR